MLDRFESFTNAISQISQSQNKLASQVMKKYNLKAAHSIYLVVLDKNVNGITSHALSELCSKDKAEISRAVGLMEENGLVYRENTTKSRYDALIKLTDKGKETAKEIENRVIKAVELAGMGLMQKNREIFYDSLEKIAYNLKRISEEDLGE